MLCSGCTEKSYQLSFTRSICFCLYWLVICKTLTIAFFVTTNASPMIALSYRRMLASEVYRWLFQLEALEYFPFQTQLFLNFCRTVEIIAMTVVWMWNIKSVSTRKSGRTRQEVIISNHRFCSNLAHTFSELTTLKKCGRGKFNA